MPARNDYLVRKQRTGRYYLYAFDAWIGDVGGLLEQARGYDSESAALQAAQKHAHRVDRHDAIVARENADGSTTQIGNVGDRLQDTRRSGSYARNSSNYWVWALGRGGKPLTSEGPWGPYDYAAARQYARISATNGSHDRAVSQGQDPLAASFEIVRVYRAGSGEQKYGMAQRLGAPLAANRRRRA